jgi:hypothetical protein
LALLLKQTRKLVEVRRGGTVNSGAKPPAKRLPKVLMGSKDPHALKIYARTAEKYRRRSISG